MPVARSLFRALIPEWVRQGYSASRMIRESKALGVATYRRQDMLADIREHQGFMRLESVVRKFDVDALPHRGLMVETDLRRDRKYRVFSNVTTQHATTGAIETRTVSFYSDELRSFNDWEAIYRDLVEDAQYEPEKDILYMEIRAIEHNQGWRY